MDEKEKRCESSEKLKKKKTAKVAKEPDTHNQDLARKGEQAAARYLERRGYDILEMNWSCTFGEADIIAKDEACIVFVEVKTRTNVEHGLPEEAVTAKKRARYERIAGEYLSECPYVDIRVRFDVIGILVTGPDRALIRHHINAFG